jgi:hypothetical protein
MIGKLTAQAGFALAGADNRPVKIRAVMASTIRVLMVVASRSD